MYFSIGGYAFAGDWSFLGDDAAAGRAGEAACALALAHGVGIELDYEGGADPTASLKAFARAFRGAGCAMGAVPLTVDLFGSPGGASWGPALAAALVPPTGAPGDAADDDDDAWLDFANVMVIDACGASAECMVPFWEQWEDNGALNLRRATFGLVAGGALQGVCDGGAADDVADAWAWAAARGAHGLTSWAVCPGLCGDWQSSCNDDAPGFTNLCETVGSCGV